jgi:AraC family transcriptional regulator
MVSTSPSVTGNLLKSIELSQWMNKTVVLSSQQIGWNGMLVEQCQSSSTSSSEIELPALSDHWLNLPMGHPARLIQKRDDCLHESIVQKGDTILVPAGQPSYWCGDEGDICSPLHICLKPELIEQVAEASEINTERFDLVNCFGQQDLQLHQVAMLLLAELRSDGMMGRLYVESLTQVLVIHLLRHYSTVKPTITSENRSLSHVQLQQAVNYIHILFSRINSVMTPSWAYPTTASRFLHHRLNFIVSSFWRLVEFILQLQIQWTGFGNQAAASRLKAVQPTHKLVSDLRSATAIAPDNYYRFVAEGRIQPHHAEVFGFSKDTLKLKQGKEIQCDVVVLSLGSQTPVFPLLPQKYRHLLEVHKDGVQLYRHLIHPGIPNLGFVGFNHGFLHVPAVEIGTGLESDALPADLNIRLFH